MSSGQELPPGRLRPLEEAFVGTVGTVGSSDAAAIAGVKMIATDVDGTLTRDARLCPRVVDRIAELVAAGVEVLAFGCRLDPEGIRIAAPLPFHAP